jgi:hypothetical protein
VDLLGGQLAGGLDGALAGDLAGGQPLTPRPLTERLHTHRVQHVASGGQLLPRVSAQALVAQPLAVEQVDAGELGSNAGAFEVRDRGSRLRHAR